MRTLIIHLLGLPVEVAVISGIEHASKGMADNNSDLQWCVLNNHLLWGTNSRVPQIAYNIFIVQYLGNRREERTIMKMEVYTYTLQYCIL